MKPLLLALALLTIPGDVFTSDTSPPPTPKSSDASVALRIFFRRLATHREPSRLLHGVGLTADERYDVLNLARELEMSLRMQETAIRQLMTDASLAEPDNTIRLARTWYQAHRTTEAFVESMKSRLAPEVLDRISAYCALNIAPHINVVLTTTSQPANGGSR